MNRSTSACALALLLGGAGCSGDENAKVADLSPIGAAEDAGTDAGNNDDDDSFVPDPSGDDDAADEVDAGDGDPEPPPPPPTLDFSAFDAAVDAYVKEKALKGASAVVVHADWGMLHESGYGEFAKDRIYLIASTSKILSVGVLLRLADQGLVDFDEPVSTYLGDWGDFKTDITLAQMFSNSSGLVSLTDNPLYLPYLCQYTLLSPLSECSKAIYTANDSVDRKPPDSEFHYGGGQWQLAGGVAEVVSGKSWAELIEETYVTPCGAESLGYTNQFQDATFGTLGLGVMAYPTFFSGDPATLPVTTNPSIEGGAYIAAADYGKLLLMHLRGGRCGDEQVLSADAVQRMREDRIGEVYGGSTTSEELAGYGLGFWVDRDHEGVVADPGLYGAISFIDEQRKYAVFFGAEGGSGPELMAQVKPELDALFDGI